MNWLLNELMRLASMRIRVGLFSQYFFHLLDSEKSNKLLDPSCSFKIGYLLPENLLNF